MQAREEQILELFSQLAEPQQEALLSYAGYLVAEYGVDPDLEISEPLDIPRPGKESVIAAIRRLTESYPMVDKRTMLDEISSLMMQHTLKGQPAVDVIDELEKAFRRQYEKLCESVE